MWRRRSGTAVALAAAALLAPGCGDDDGSDGGVPDPTAERADKPAKPPARWRTVGNRRAGFTLSVPQSWTVRRKAGDTTIFSDYRLVSITVSADRTSEGREVPAEVYAEETVRQLEGFRGRLAERVRHVRGSPYRNVRVDARGRLHGSRVPQHITAVAYQRPGRVTYILLVFRDRRLPRFNERFIDRVLRSFRAQPPDITP